MGWKTMSAALALVACTTGLPGPASAQNTQTEMIATGWSLEKPTPKARQARRTGQATGPKALPHARQNQKIRAGAQFNNRSGRNNRNAKVGVAVPF